MSIYRLTSNTQDNYRQLVCQEPSDSIIMSDFVFKSPEKSLSKPIAVQYIEGKFLDPTQPILENDYPCLYGIIPVFSSRAVKAMEEGYFRGAVLAELKSKYGQFYACRPSGRSNCIDLSQSSIKKMERGFIRQYNSLAFHRQQLAGVHIFHVPELSTEVFVTESFKENALSSGLTGMIFLEVENSEVCYGEDNQDPSSKK